MKIFISGRVNGLPRAEAVRNFERGKQLILNNGWLYVNPLYMVPEGATNAEAMAILLPVLAKDCDGILLMNDHKFSEGSHVEKMTALYCKKAIFYEDDLT